MKKIIEKLLKKDFKLHKFSESLSKLFKATDYLEWYYYFENVEIVCQLLGMSEKQIKDSSDYIYECYLDFLDKGDVDIFIKDIERL